MSPLEFAEFDVFFFSSRRRHTRSLRDWSSDVCSSDLAAIFGVMAAAPNHTFQVLTKRARRMREWFRSEERREGKSVDLGGRRIIKKKKKREGREWRRVVEKQNAQTGCACRVWV